MKLFICGNGFDKHHGFLTGYDDYRKFLKDNYPQSFNAFERFMYLDISTTDRWSDLEDSLMRIYSSNVTKFIYTIFTYCKSWI